MARDLMAWEGYQSEADGSTISSCQADSVSRDLVGKLRRRPLCPNRVYDVDFSHGNREAEDSMPSHWPIPETGLITPGCGAFAE